MAIGGIVGKYKLPIGSSSGRSNGQYIVEPSYATCLPLASLLRPSAVSRHENQADEASRLKTAINYWSSLPPACFSLFYLTPYVQAQGCGEHFLAGTSSSNINISSLLKLYRPTPHQSTRCLILYYWKWE